jgi:SPP1 gp7 family putative phage head morphogenesis protein
VIYRAVETTIVPMLPALVSTRGEFRPDTREDAIDDVPRLWRRVAIITEEAFSDDDIKAMALRRGETIAKHNRETISRNIFKVVAVNPIFSDAYLANELSLFAVANVNLITSLRDDTLKKLQTQMLVDLQRGRRAEDLAKELLSSVDPSVSNPRARANLIARDQVAKLNGQLTQLRQQDIGVTRYRWRTMGDARVRDSHQELNGQVFSWDDPPEPGHPGDDFQCRCYAEPVLEDVVDGVEEPEF